MCTFVPNGNKPIKTDVAEQPKEQIPVQEPAPIKSGLSPFPGWKRRNNGNNDEFVVDL